MFKRTLGFVLFTAYLLILFRITVFRDGFYTHGLFSGNIVWIPFQTVFGYLNTGHPQLFYYLFFGNIVWFVPFGAYLYLRGFPAWKAIVLSAALSVLIETLQFVFGSGTSETEDVILNTAGGAAGCAFVSVFRRIKRIK